jgi:hypothetical protein
MRVSGLSLCPRTDPLAGYHHRYYPINYPNPPPKTVRVDRCFTSTKEAFLGGYRLAPTPSGSVLVGGVYLVPSSRFVTSMCRSSIRTAHLVVPCPTLIPGTPTSVACDTATPCAQPGWFVLEGSFAGPPGYIGVTRGAGHLWIIAFTHRAGVWPADTLVGGHLIRTTHVRGHAANFITFPYGSGLNSGHVVLIWHVGQTTYAVSLHGHTKVNERLDLAIANHLRLLTR